MIRPRVRYTGSMTQDTPSLALAVSYHHALPARLASYLRGRGIPDDLIVRYLLGFDGQRITIPIFNREGQLAFFKLAKDPDDRRAGPKMLTTPGSTVELYGWEHLRGTVEELILCEGEFDRLVLEAQGFPAVTSTGGAQVFRHEWADALKAVPRVFVCFDRDAAGRAGALQAARMIPSAKIVEFSADVGESGDVTDFFVRLGRSLADFRCLLDAARPAPAARPQLPTVSLAHLGISTADPDAARLKAQVPIEQVIARYVPLRERNGYLMGRCPFHEDRTPSLVVYPVTRTFRCFGCGAKGDAISFLRKVEHLSFVQALDRLRELSA